MYMVLSRIQHAYTSLLSFDSHGYPLRYKVFLLLYIKHLRLKEVKLLVQDHTGIK